MPKKNFLWCLWSSTKHTLISKTYCRLFAVTEVLRKTSGKDFFYRDGRLLEHERLLGQTHLHHSTSWIKYSKWRCPIPAITTKDLGVSSEKFCSVATWFILSCKQFHFDSVSECECRFKPGLSTSEADTVSFFFKRFLPFAFTLTETMTSHYNLPRQPDKRTSQAYNLFPAHFIQPIRRLHWLDTCVPKAAVACVGYRSKLKAQISSRNMHKYKKKRNRKMPRPFFIFSVRMDFFIFFNFQKSEFSGFKKLEINFFWPDCQTIYR